ncbi:MAG: glycosyltransferase family 4 protein [Candidatus Pacebacteria bacterium]|nr:glycosyltransferase family 4 protein [Candidatus Paceibacterota bacterium]
MSRGRTVLFVGMTESVHAARWMRQTAALGFERHVFPSAGLGLHPDLSDVTVHYLLAAPQPERGLQCQPQLWPLSAGGWRANRWRRDRLLAREYRDTKLRARQLAHTISRLDPDLIHTLETQHAGYLALEAREQLGSQFPPWLHTPWGSDLYLFGRLQSHEPRIRKMLSLVDAYQPKSNRDAKLARDYGFQGKIFAAIPGNGGFDVSAFGTLCSPVPPSQRKLIHLKGYQGWAGRALFALRALYDIRSELTGFRIRVTSATNEIVIAVELLRREHGLDIEVVPSVSHEEIMKLHGSARVSLGASISDGVPNSMLEAMAMGAFPIESRGSCADEWFVDGCTGLIVDPEDTAGIGAALVRALRDDQLVDGAAAANRHVIEERLNLQVIDRLARDMYGSMLSANN